jgi:MoaA/NifB/PqqE/SkfB family radical SAM enzyme
MTDRRHVALFDQAIHALLRDALRICAGEPAMAAWLVRTLRQQRRAARLRQASAAAGVEVPPLLILSVTQRCNLHCKGCYAQALHRDATQELSTDELARVLDEAQELGISIVLLAGGEPLLRPDLLELAQSHREMIFPLFTNGMLLDDATLDRLAQQRHVLPVISLEGHQADTDGRRGLGVHAHSLQTMGRLRERGLFFGTSITVTRQNYATVSAPAYLADLIASGCRLFFLIEYVPTVPGTEALVLTDAQRDELPAVLEELRSALPGLFVELPGDEELYGGCLAAGRGFVHISADGRLEPCPFAPFSDVSVRDTSLADALRSPFLRALRESDLHLAETQGGCTLWAQREQVLALLGQHVAGQHAPVALE